MNWELVSVLTSYADMRSTIPGRDLEVYRRRCQELRRDGGTDGNEIGRIRKALASLDDLLDFGNGGLYSYLQMSIWRAKK